MKQERKVIHVYVKAQNKDFYFGSIKAIYSVLDASVLGLQYQSIVNYFATNETDVYENAKCVIRKDNLITQSTKRGRVATETKAG